jgi:hypothetical protein
VDPQDLFIFLADQKYGKLLNHLEAQKRCVTMKKRCPTTGFEGTGTYYTTAVLNRIEDPGQCESIFI